MAENKASLDMHFGSLKALEHKQVTTEPRIPVLLPDMFVSFLAQKPRVYSHYERVKRESEA